MFNDYPFGEYKTQQEYGYYLVAGEIPLNGSAKYLNFYRKVMI